MVRILARGRVTRRVQEGIQSLVAPIQCRFFCTQRDLGFATAVTCAVFLPHREHRIRSASSLSVVFQPRQSCKCVWLNLTARAALTHHTHEEVAEAVIEPLDVSEHAHAHMVRSRRARVCSVRDNVLNCTTSGRN